MNTNVTKRAVRSAAFSVLIAGQAAWPGAALGSDAPVVPKLTGAWTLNRELSDAPRVPGAGGEEGGGGHRGHGGGGGGGMGGPGGHGGVGGMGGGMGGGYGRGGGTGGGGEGQRPTEEEMKQRRALMQEVLEASTRLTITQDGDRIVFTDGDGRTRTYLANGKKEKHQVESATIETKSKWEEGGLVIESELGQGTKVKQAYTVTDDPRRLVITTSIDNPRMERDRQRPPIKRVYDEMSATEP